VDLADPLRAAQRPATDITRFEQALVLRHPDLSAPLARRLARCYGSRVDLLLRDGLGTEVAPGLFEAELNYLHQHEWARCADDVLWRRTKLGLHLNPVQREQVARWCEINWDDNTAAQTAWAATRPSEIAWN